MARNYGTVSQVAMHWSPSFPVRRDDGIQWREWIRSNDRGDRVLDFFTVMVRRNLSQSVHIGVDGSATAAFGQDMHGESADAEAR